MNRSEVCKHLVPYQSRCASCADELRDKSIAALQRDVADIKAQLREQAPAPLWMHLVARWLL